MTILNFLKNIDKDNLRTEIYVIKYSEKLRQNILPWAQ